jgi:hypothetical protein
LPKIFQAYKKPKQSIILEPVISGAEREQTVYKKFFKELLKLVKKLIIIA